MDGPLVNIIGMNLFQYQNVFSPKGYGQITLDSQKDPLAIMKDE